jgi:hypothetical protein
MRMEIELQPFMKYQVVALNSTNYSRKQILENYLITIKKRHEVTLVWGGTDEDPWVKIIYPDKQAFSRSFLRNMPLFERILQFYNQNPEHFRDLSLSPIDSENLFLIVKITTNLIQDIRQNYQFSFKLGEIMGIHSQYEEVVDGFLIFYQNPEDFFFVQVDKLDIPATESWLRQHNKWNAQIEFLFKSIFDQLIKEKNKP